VGRKLFKSEADLARAIISWLADQHWEIFQEVQVKRGGPRADIVARQGKLVWVVECKLTFGLSVLDQASYWLGRANLVSIATPWRDFGTFTKRAMSGIGLGALVGRSGRGGSQSAVVEVIRPRLFRKRSVPWSHLAEEHKSFARAGNNRSAFWSPFKETCRKLRSTADEHPGILFRDVLRTIKTHYASVQSARSSLIKWINGGQIEGVKLVRDGRDLRLFPAGFQIGTAMTLDSSRPEQTPKLSADMILSCDQEIARVI
jgi:hypothetical protein